MRPLGETCLLISLVATGYAAVLSLWRGSSSRAVQRLTAGATVIGFTSLTITITVLCWALVTRNFHFEYVAQYASRLLPWQYCFSALWVGQAGSLLLWAWMTGLLAVVLRIVPTRDVGLRDTSFGLVMANVCFLVVVMVFAADPMAANPIASVEGGGLSPLLQHPSMLIHPPVVFFAYALWTVPGAFALAALWLGRTDAIWTQMARPWALCAWTVLGAGLLLGANWAYQELGWGGYWGWDPVENGSLLPWLTGTAFIHCAMGWKYRGRFKKTTFALALATCALCNFATFLTRSGIFSSVHAFSESPIGWMFLAFMGGVILGGGALLVHRRHTLHSPPLPSYLFARESCVLVATFLLSALTIVVLMGTLVAPISKLATGRMIQVGPGFYNNVLPPVGLGLLTMTAVVPLLRWGAPITASGKRLLVICVIIAVATAGASFVAGVHDITAFGVIGLAALTICTFVAAVWQSAWRRQTGQPWLALGSTLTSGRRKYAAYAIHSGVACVAIGIAGSSLGTQRQEFTLAEGERLQWQGHDIHYVRLDQRQLPDKLVAEAVLEVVQAGGPACELRPARHLHLLQNEWTSEVAIHSTWSHDFYTILNAGLGDGRIAITFVLNPLMRWIWLGGYIAAASAVVAAWPSRRVSRQHAAWVVNSRSRIQQSGELRHRPAA